MTNPREGASEAAANTSTMASPSDVDQFERHLFRQGLGALEADRSQCADCGRTPLIGEHVHLYDARPARPNTDPQLVCELCRQLRREPPLASELVLHSEHGQTVRLTVRAA